MSSISKAEADEKIGEFWDTHDFTEFDTDAPDAQFEVIEEQTAKRRMKVEALVNQRLQQDRKS
ncbi:MAG TPA: hypothetical protein VN476_17815 [Pyrinomonadaceae bacterium]|nr:hypothetical protein [Pyrinomonadaceae bacterium]